MATQVPYTPIPSVSPQDSPTPYRQTPTPIDAFGGAVAAATQHLGDVASQSGNEIFARAVAMQQLKDDADATTASSDYLNQSADLAAKYQTLQGKDAVDGLDPYKQSLEDLRNNLAGKLNSPYTTQAFNQSTRFMQSRFVMAGASHAAEQNKSYQINSLKSNIEAQNNASMANPEDLDSVYAGLASVKASAADLASQTGMDPTSTKLLIDKTASSHMSSWLTSLARTQPIEAQKYFQKAVTDGNLSGDDIGKVNTIVTNQMHIVASRQFATQAATGSDLHYGSGLVPISRAQDAIGGYESHNDYSQTGPITRSGDHALGRYQIMGNNLQPWLKEAGMPSMSEGDFLANTKAQDQLFNFKFGQYMSQYGSFNAAANAWFTGSATPNTNVTDATSTTKGHTPAQYLAGTNARLAKSASMEDVATHAIDIAKAAAPDDPDLPQYTQQRVEQMYSEQTRIEKDNDFNNRQSIDGAIANGMMSGKPVTNIDQLMANPDTRNAWLQLKPSDQVSYLRAMASAANGPVRMDDKMLAQYNEIKGLQVQDPEAFLKMDVLNLNLPMNIKKELIDDKDSVYKGEQADPNTNRALDILAPKLQAANLTKTLDANGLMKFTGALRAEMKQFTLDNAHPPHDDDMNLIGSRLLQKQGSGGGLFGIGSTPGGGQPLYNIDVPNTAADIIRKDPKWAALGITPTDEDIQQIYVYNLYQQQFGKKNAQ